MPELLPEILPWYSQYHIRIFCNFTFYSKYEHLPIERLDFSQKIGKKGLAGG